MGNTPLRILYGVQATGNGHITRARTLVPALQQQGADVACLFSGRDPAKLFDMDVFGHFETREGFTFAIDKGKVDYLKTVFNSNAPGFMSDVRKLDLRNYDLVISDYEPVTAWAAKRAGIPSIGIGHQYAFTHKIPMEGANAVSRGFMNYFAPVKTGLGLHWHHFDQAILPPVFEPVVTSDVEPGKIVIYMDFENLDEVKTLLKPFDQNRFMIYTSATKTAMNEGNLCLRPLSRDGFRADLADCEGVITNAGFELPSEVLQMGKKLLVKPLMGQMEQMSNAKALRQLNLGGTMNKLDHDAVATWLGRDDYAHVTFPEMGPIIAQWVLSGDVNDAQPLIAKAWAETKFTP